MNTIHTYYQDPQSLKIFVKNNHGILSAGSVLVQAFCGNFDKAFLQSMVCQIHELIPNAQIIGTTANDEIMNGTVSKAKTVLSFSVFQYSSVKVAFVPQRNSNSYELGQSIAAQLKSEKAKLLILFSTGMKVDASRMLDGVYSVNHSLPLAGGISGYDQNHSGFVFCNDGITDCGAVGAVLEGNRLSVNQYWQFGWIPIGKEMTITKADGLRVYTIDDLPAYQMFQKYLGADAKNDMTLHIFPLIVHRRGTEIASMPLLVHEDDSIDFSGNMIEREKVRFSFGSIEMILKAIDQLIQNVKSQGAESIFVYSCTLRRGYLQDSSEIETLPLQKIAPTSGFFTNGEFFHLKDSNILLQATMTTTALSESGQLKEAPVETPMIQDDFVSKSNNVIVLKALTNLVNMVTKELNERTEELERINKETLFASIHDPLTGIYNRGFYEQEMNRLNFCSVPLAIIICDVDGLKFVNDTLGHKAGDTLLKATAEILRSSFDSQNFVARIGGDEYSVLIPNGLLSDLESAIQLIRQTIADFNAGGTSVPLSLSIGYANCENSFGNMDDLFKTADNNMYREKLNHRKSIRGDLVQSLIQTLEAKDKDTVNHSKRMQVLLKEFADYLGLSPSHASDLLLFARFHDVGKVGIPEHILLKQPPLTLQENMEMQRHCEIGYRIAHSSADLLPIADWILKHHEWWNGKGYPYGLSGGEIPLECRILAIVDAYDSMINDHPYQRAIRPEEAVHELKHSAGTQFDPELVKKFIASLESVHSQKNDGYKEKV